MRNILYLLFITKNLALHQNHRHYLKSNFLKVKLLTIIFTILKFLKV